MKALSVQQPWATAILAYGKNVENRSWQTRYRGRFYVHASKKIDKHAWGLPKELEAEFASLVTGAIIGSVELSGCIADYDSMWAQPGMWHWVLRNPRLYKTPYPCKGKLGFFCPDIHVDWRDEPDRNLQTIHNTD